MGAFSSDSDQKVSADDGDQAAANEGVSIFFGRRSIESVKSSAVKRCNSIPKQYLGDLNNAPSPGSVARKAAFFDQYIRTVSLEKAASNVTDDNLLEDGEADVARSIDFCSASKEPQEAQSKEKEQVLPILTCENNQVEAASGRDLSHSEGDSVEESQTNESSSSQVLQQVQHTVTLNGSIDTRRLIASKKIESSSDELRNHGNEGRVVTGPNGKDTATEKSETVKATEYTGVIISGVRKETPKATNLRRIAHDPNHALKVASEVTKACSSNGTPFSLAIDKRSQSKSKSRNGLTSGACMGAKPQVTSKAPKEQATKRNVKPSKNDEAKDERAPTNMSSKAKGAKLNDGNGFKFKSDERAEKRKEFNLRIEEKQSAKQAEKTKIQAKTQEEMDADIKELRRALAFKATPMPNFYQEGKADVRRVPAQTRAKSPSLAGFEKACNSSVAINGQAPVAECKQERNTNLFTSPGITGNCTGERDEERSRKVPAKAKIHKGLQNGALKKVASTSADNSTGKGRGKRLQVANNKPSTATAKHPTVGRASPKHTHTPDSAIAVS